MPVISAKYGGRVDFKGLDVTDQNNLALLISISARFTKDAASTPAMLVGDKLLRGREMIERELAQTLDTLLARPATANYDLFKTDRIGFFTNISAANIIGRGLADSLNPCTLAAIAFFLSFMTLYGWRKREILTAGANYCLAVFLTYLGLSLGLFQFLYPFFYRRTGYILIQGFYYLAAAACLLLALAALFDYIRFKKTGDAGDTVLRLPDFLNMHIASREVGSRQRKDIELAGTAFMMGALVSLLEAACVGGVYIPATVSILKTAAGGLKAASFLVLYNLMLVLPLAIIWSLACAGTNSAKAADLFKKNLGPLKILMFSAFLLLATLIITKS